MAGESSAPAEGTDRASLRDTAWAMSEENVEAVKRSYERFNTDGVEGAAKDFWHEDIVWHDPEEFPDAEIYHGIEAAKAALQGYVDLGGHMKVQVEEYIDAGDEVFTGWQVHGRGASSGAPVEGSMYHVSTVKHGKLVRLRQYLNRDKALKAAGLRE
jgi:ketosteroid isomerase-like protein